MTAEQKEKSIAYWGMRDEDDNNRVHLQKTFERPTWNATEAPEGFEPADWKYKGLWVEFKAEQLTEPAT